MHALKGDNRKMKKKKKIEMTIDLKSFKTLTLMQYISYSDYPVIRKYPGCPYETLLLFFLY